MIKLIARPEAYARLKNEERVIKAIQLMKILGTIRYNNILQTRLMSAEDYNVSWHIHLIYIHAASLYEGIKTFCENNNFLRSLSFYKTNIVRIKTINKEYSHHTSFLNQVLKPIRNEIAFHFDENIISKNLIKYIEDCEKESQELILISGNSTLVKDTTYDIADNLTINYALDTVAGSSLPIEEKVNLFSKKLMDLSNLFLDILEGLIAELLVDFGIPIQF